MLKCLSLLMNECELPVQEGEHLADVLSASLNAAAAASPVDLVKDIKKDVFTFYLP